MSAAPAPLPSRRDHLLASAWRLFYREGYQRIGIDTLLAEAGVAKMTLYHHFKSKEELIVTLLDERGGAILASLDRSIAAAGPKPVARFLAVFDWLAEWFAGDDFRGCAFLRARAEFPDPAHPVHQAGSRFKAAFRERLLTLARENGARRPAAVADALSLVVDGAIVAAHGGAHTTAGATAKAAARTLLESGQA